MDQLEKHYHSKAVEKTAKELNLSVRETRGRLFYQKHGWSGKQITDLQTARKQYSYPPLFMT